MLILLQSCIPFSQAFRTRCFLPDLYELGQPRMSVRQMHVAASLAKARRIAPDLPPRLVPAVSLDCRCRAASSPQPLRSGGRIAAGRHDGLWGRRPVAQRTVRPDGCPSSKFLGQLIV